MIRQIDDLKRFKARALHWASSFDVVSYLDSCNFKDPYTKFDSILAVGISSEITADAGTAFDELEQFRKINPGWISGFFGYDLKNETENLVSNHPDHLSFPDLYFFAPKHLIIINGNQAELITEDPALVFQCIESQDINPPTPSSVIDIQTRFSKNEYLDTVEKIKGHINRGDIYVTNFCQEFFALNAVIDPLGVFFDLNRISPNPFSAFFKWHNNYIICASPERFLAKRGNQLISQPIKGTAKRGKTDHEDELIKRQLRNNTKELQENVMIVDLVRNDLTRSAKQGTVKTEEMFGIYSFNQLHQMISTIVCQLQDTVPSVRAIKASFPMGSMTGAPKINAMRLMELYERSKRGVYSGAIGYFSADGDFDFNVVIRSILYNKKSNYLSFHTGSAITWHADAEKEYEECLLKARAILQALGLNGSFQ